MVNIIPIVRREGHSPLETIIGMDITPDFYQWNKWIAWNVTLNIKTMKLRSFEQVSEPHWIVFADI